MPKPRNGSGWLPSKASPARSNALGLSYATGEGVLKDNAEAVKWFPAGRRTG